MEQFRALILGFLNRKIPLEQARGELAVLAQAHPQLVQQFIRSLDHVYSQRHLTPQAYTVLSHAIIEPEAVLNGSASDDIELDPLVALDNTSKNESGSSPVSSPVSEEDGHSEQSEEEEDDSTVYRVRTSSSADRVSNKTPDAPEDDATRIKAPDNRTAQTHSSTGSSAPVSAMGSSWRDSSSWISDVKHATTQVLTTGSVIKGRFVLEEMLGRGGMGTVYKAKDLLKVEAQDRNPYVALKLLNEDFKKHPDSLKALQRESSKAQELQHQNIVNVHYFDRDGGNVYMTMELLDGEPLSKLIKRHRGKGIPWSKALPIVREMSLALSYAHRKNIIHSDFKPGNCFLTKNGTVKVIDFGIARAAKRNEDIEGEETKFDIGTLGALTPAYATCEMIDGKEPDQRDDVYALACVTYELLAGQHPYGKLSGAKALEKGLVPKPIEGLPRQQMKALKHGLALKREARTPSAYAFLQEMNPSPARANLKIGLAVAVVLLLGAVSVFVVPDWFYNRKMTQISTGLSSQDFEVMSGSIDRLSELKTDDQQILLKRHDAHIIANFDNEIGRYFARDSERFDYPNARNLIDELLVLYSDSARVVKIEEQVERDREELQAQWSEDFNAFLQTRQLLPSDDELDIYDLRATIALIDANDPILSDQRLPQALVQEARGAAQNLDFELANQLIAVGLSVSPGDINLINVRDEVQTQQTAIEQAARIEELEDNIRHLGQRRLDVEDIEDAKVRRDLASLYQMQPRSAPLQDAQARIRDMVERQIDQSLKQRHWGDARNLLAQVEDILDDGFIENVQSSINQSKQQFDSAVDAVLVSIETSVGEFRLNDAESQLQELAQMGAPADAIESAKNRIATAYVNSARIARSKQDWDEARILANKGIELEPSDVIIASLGEEIIKIDNQETLAAQELRAQEVEDIQTRIFQAMTAEEFDKGNLDAVLADVDQLQDRFIQNAAVADYVETTQLQIVEKVSQSAKTLAQNDNWESARALLTAAEVALGEEVAFNRIFDQTRAALGVLQQEQETRAQQQRMQSVEQRIAALLEKPLLDQLWSSKLERELEALQQLEPNNPYLQQARQQAASLHLVKAQDLRTRSRWNLAEQQLQRAIQLAPELPTVKEEREVFDREYQAYQLQEQQDQNEAQISAMKENFKRQLQARNLVKAIEILDELKSEIDGDDDFVTAEAPRQLVQAALTKASESAASHGYSSALGTLDLVKAYTQGNSNAVKARELYTAQRNAYVYSQRGTVSQFNQLAKMVPWLKENMADYTTFERTLQNLAARRISNAAETDLEAAKELLTAAQKSFPSLNVVLRSVDPPVVDSGTSAGGRNDDIQLPPTRTTERTAGKPCDASRAGRKSYSCYDEIVAGRLPRLVVIPGGTDGQPFAMSREEISRAQFNLYCEQTQQCQPLGGMDTFPATGIPIAQIQDYVLWLSSVSNNRYSLPSLTQWQHAARADGSPWSTNRNCKRMERGQQASGHKLEDVSFGGGSHANAWGLRNIGGNAQEIVSHGNGFVAAGGYYGDRLRDCNPDFTRPFNGADANSGFRVVRTIRQ